MAEQFITAKYTGIDREIRRFGRVETIVKDPNMAPIMNAIAEVWEVNFDAEGSMVGGWRELTESTQRLRQARGFGPDHPILKQTGALRSAAIEALKSVKGKSAIYSGSGVRMNYSSSDGQAQAVIEGEKVTNQFRSRVRGRFGFSAPPRRFWFVDSTVTNAASAALLKSVNEEIKKVR